MGLFVSFLNSVLQPLADLFFHVVYNENGIVDLVVVVFAIFRHCPRKDNDGSPVAVHTFHGHVCACWCGHYAFICECQPGYIHFGIMVK